jgi:glycosyltransferase involved in cell wall biosynthesis
MKRWLCDEFPRIGRRVCLIENGIENVFLEVHKQRGVKKSDSKVRVVTIGSLIPRKGIDQIIKAMAQATNRENLRLSIIGTGPEAGALSQMVSDLGLARNVRFVGQVAASDIPDTLVDADIFVLASHSEGRPNVILEAMAARLPVIATNIDGNKELIAHNENGLLFQDGAVEELTRHLESLSREAELRDKLGGNARRFIVEHGLSWSNTACRYSELYSSLI